MEEGHTYQEASKTFNIYPNTINTWVKQYRTTGSLAPKKRLISIAQNYGNKVIFLPPYYPEFNPIENFWAFLNARLQKFLPQLSLF